MPLSVTAPQVLSSLDTQQGQQNVIIIVFDALSAYHVSLHGYQRDTTPNLARLSERAVVYHNHYAGGNFTSPGTASLLTGTLPWTHRAFNKKGVVDKSYSDKNIFRAFQDYYKITYTHNPWAGYILNQFKKDIEDYIPVEKLLLTSDKYIQALFGTDDDIATVGWGRTIKSREEGFAYSLFLSHFYRKYRDNQIKGLLLDYPRGLPHNLIDNYFLLENAIDFLDAKMAEILKPFLGYFHFWPPHDPYHTQRDFFRRFSNDGVTFISKPLDIFSDQGFSNTRLRKNRMKYDEYILYADKEFGHFYANLEKLGLLENTWIVITSDHGEMFERGIEAHSTPVLYEPVIRVPLMIFEPGRNTRTDVYMPTSAIDVLPTLLGSTTINRGHEHHLAIRASFSLRTSFPMLQREPKLAVALEKK